MLLYNRWIGLYLKWVRYLPHTGGHLCSIRHFCFYTNSGTNLGGRAVVWCYRLSTNLTVRKHLGFLKNPQEDFVTGFNITIYQREKKLFKE